jgi:phosphatidylglycerol:prolipoprotein diacylglycerol transferase
MLYALGHYAEFTKRPLSFLYIWEGGLVWFGGLLTALLWLAWYLPRHPDLGKFAFLDVLARGACLALVFGWFASLAAGDQYGKVTTVPWGVPATWYQDGTQASHFANTQSRLGAGDLASLRLHPTQLYESLFALALFFVLARYAKRRPVSGRVTALFLMAHAVGRAAIEVFRADEFGNQRSMVVEGVLSLTQLLCIPLFVAGLTIWLIRKPDARSRAPGPHANPRPPPS